VGRIFPAEWNRFAGAVPAALQHLPLADAYAALLFDADPAVRDHAAREWCVWEDAHVPLRQATCRIRATWIRNFASSSHAWSRTIGGTPPSSARTNCFTRPRH
jgi:hypothetical protein